MIWWKRNPLFRSSTSSLQDRVLGWVLRTAGLAMAAVVALIVGYVASEAYPSLRDVGLNRLFGDPSWHPAAERYNLTPMVLGTLAATAGSLLLTAPLGIGSALFLRFWAPPTVAIGYRRVLEVLAGVPSVVYGLWGLVVLAPLIARISPEGQGQSLLAGVLILTLMTLPTIALAADAAIGAVPSEHLRGAAALGLGRSATVTRVVIPGAAPGIATGAILQTARALGETMAVLMVCGNIVQTPGSVFDPVRTLTANIALEMGYADERHRSILFAGGLLLLLLVAVLVLGVETLERRKVRPA